MKVIGTRGRRSQILVTAISLCLPLVAQAVSANQSRPTSWAFNSTIPLGTDLLVLRPSKLQVALMASAESEQFKSWRLIEENDKRRVIDADGQPVKKMPSRVTFRITAGTKDKLTDTPGYPIETETNLNNFLLKLRFRVKIFRGVDARIVEPHEVKMIGIPADEPYNERIFRAAFDLGDVNIDERVVLEVIDGDTNQRISKFHLEF
jgi:hypothetical protein